MLVCRKFIQHHTRLESFATECMTLCDECQRLRNRWDNGNAETGGRIYLRLFRFFTREREGQWNVRMPICVHLFNDVFDAVNTSKRNRLLFARGCHANYKHYVGLNIADKQYDRVISCFNVLLQLINIICA